MRYAIALFFVLIIQGCASTKQNLDVGYTVYHDPYKNFTRYSVIPSGPLDGQSLLSLNFVTMDVFVDKRQDSLSMSLAIIYEGENWIFINEGESLVLSLDGKMMPLTTLYGSWNNRSVKYAGRVREEAHYKFTPENLHELNKASVVTLRVYGREFTLERQISDKQKHHLQLFEDKFIVPNQMRSAE